MASYSTRIYGADNISFMPSEDNTYRSNLSTGSTVTWFGGGTTSVVQVNDPDNFFSEANTNQTLAAPATWEGTNYTAGQVVSPSFGINFTDGSGNSYTVISFNFSPNTANQLADSLVWVGNNVPPNGTVLTVTSEFNTAGGTTPLNSDLAVCFASETLMQTNKGPVPAGKVTEAHTLRDVHGDYWPVRMRTHRTLGTAEFLDTPNHIPCCIPAGALGHGLPFRDLVVSANHGIFLKSDVARNICGIDTPMISAKFLCDFNGIHRQVEREEVTWIHFLLDHHVALDVHGIGAESLLLSPQVLRTLPEPRIKELRRKYPMIWRERGKTPHHRLSRKQSEKLLVRSVKNNKPLCQQAETRSQLTGSLPVTQLCSNSSVQAHL